MHPQRKRRLYGVLFIILGVSIAVALAATAFRENLLFFFSPSQIVAGEAPVERNFRVGGLVVEGSVQRDPLGTEVRFELTDQAHNVRVVYDGILPDLFREGQGIIAMGQLDSDGVFRASQVLAKHDENYMPPEVAEALRAAGQMPAHEMEKRGYGDGGYTVPGSDAEQ